MIHSQTHAAGAYNLDSKRSEVALFIVIFSVAPNGERYPLVGGTRQRHFAGTNSKPRKLLENAQTPTSRVHALFGGSMNARLAYERKA